MTNPTGDVPAKIARQEELALLFTDARTHGAGSPVRSSLRAHAHGADGRQLAAAARRVRDDRGVDGDVEACARTAQRRQDHGRAG